MASSSNKLLVATSSLNQDERLELDQQERTQLRNLLLEGAQSKPTGLADHLVSINGKLEYPRKFALNRLKQGE